MKKNACANEHLAMLLFYDRGRGKARELLASAARKSGPRRRLSRPSAFGLILLLLAVGLGGPATAEPTRLVMVEEAGCRFCMQWDREVGRVYARTREGRIAPLARVGRDAPELRGLRPAVYTPTFILMRGAREVGRITGYPGESWFWEELGDLLRMAGHGPELSTARDPD